MLENAFWSFYALCYDTVSRLAPYQQMLNDLAGAVSGRPLESVLDVGCGTGNVRAVLREKDETAAYTGIDQSPQMLLRARKKASRDPHAKFIRHDINQALPFEDGSFGTVICSNVLYIVQDPQAVSRELLRLVKPGGLLVVSTPHEQAGLAAHLKEHIRVAGALSLVPLFIPLLLVGLFNVIICRKSAQGNYHFLSRDAVDQLFPDAHIGRTFADQNWLIVTRPPEA